MAQSKYCSEIPLEGLKKAMKSLSQDYQCPSLDLSQVLPDYKSRALLLLHQLVH